MNTLATKSVTYRANGQAGTVCRDWAGNPISEADYNAYPDRYYAALAKSTLSLTWQQGAYYPVVAPTATPIPTPMPTPGPSPTPTFASPWGSTYNPPS